MPDALPDELWGRQYPSGYISAVVGEDGYLVWESEEKAKTCHFYRDDRETVPVLVGVKPEWRERALAAEKQLQAIREEEWHRDNDHLI